MNRDFKRIPVLFLVLVFVFIQVGCGRKEVLDLSELEAETAAEIAEMPETMSAETSGMDAEELKVCIVHICGAVQNPGVYTLTAGSRIWDAVLMAGGLAEDASESSVNLAAPVSDGMQIAIPTKEEAAALIDEVRQADVTGNLQDSEGSGDGLVNLNTATAAELMTLPGIGETRAMAILAYREEKGGFSSIEEIMQVNGIKQGSFEKLREYITVR